MEPYQEYQFDDDDNIIDPPIIREHERKMTEATATADPSLIAIAQEDYDNERRRVVDHHNKQVQQRRDDDARLLAEDRQRQDEAAANDRRNREAAAERARAEELRIREQTAPQDPQRDPPVGAGDSGANPSDPATAGEDSPFGSTTGPAPTPDQFANRGPISGTAGNRPGGENQ